MLLPALALAAALLGGWYAFTHDRQPVAIVLLAVAFGLVFVIGRRIEGRRDSDWQEAAAQMQARFDAAPAPELLRRFGASAPWDAWAQGGPLQCARAIDGSGATPPFALVQVRHAVHAPRGEDSSQQWQDAVVAVVRRGAPAAALKPVDAPTGYEAADNGEWLFVWKKPGEQPGPGGLRDLLQQARLALQRLPAGGTTPTPARP